MRLALAILILLSLSLVTSAQDIKQKSDLAFLADRVIRAHGGEKFKKMQSLIIRGTAEVSGSPTATFPATFQMIFSGDKYLLEVNNPFQPFKQVCDGRQTYSSIGNFTLPPINRLGFPLLQRMGENGFVLSELPEKEKKKLGFRITSPEGYHTDFFIDEKTGKVKSYKATYLVGNRTVTTAVEIDKFREIEGVVLPERYFQRFDLGNFTIYSDFRAKEILVNSNIDDKIFSIVP